MDFIPSSPVAESSSANGFIDLAHDLVDSQSRERGCQAITVQDVGDDNQGNVCQAALSTIIQTLNDYNAMPTVASVDLWIDGVTLPTSSIVNQEVDITIHVHDRGIYGKTSTLELRSSEAILARRNVSFNFDGDQKITLSYTPTAAGENDLDIVLAPLAEETSKTNNETTLQLMIRKE